MSATAMITVAGRQTRVRVEGDPAKPPVLLLHGVTCTLEDWAPLYPVLAGHHRVVAVDMPGSGFSDRMPETTTLAVLARGVRETLDELHETRPMHVIGNSLGGAVAMQLVKDVPERVRSLVLADSAGFGPEAALLLRLMAAPILGDLLTSRTTRGGARMAQKLNFADPAFVTEERIDLAMAVAQRPDTGRVALETVRFLATFGGARASWRADLVAAVQRVAPPTLVVWGDSDRVLPPHHLDNAARLLPFAETHLFAAVGHKPQLERPVDFARLALDFLARAEPEGGPLARSEVAAPEVATGLQHALRS